MDKKKAFLFNFCSMLCWAVSPLLIRQVRDWFSVSFQNFYRFGVAILILWIFTLSIYGRRRVVESVKKIKWAMPKLLVIAFCNFAHQFFLIKGVYLIFPGLAMIVEESTIMFAVVLAFIFIPGERRVIRQPLFIAGLALAVAGVILTSLPSLFSGTVGAGSAFGIFFVLISSLAWAFFSLLIRLWLPDTPSMVTSSLVFTLVIPFFLVSMFLEEGPGILSTFVPSSAWIILTVSGIIGIGIAYPCYYQSLKGLGVTLTSGLSLLIPLFTAVISFFMFGEVLSPVQLAGTAVLLSGCLIIVRTGFGL
ncbi:MAG: DMT family transporter [Spirochaetales bacterium]|nr:DMT family transporter [Spirochaetales bacterium]